MRKFSSHMSRPCIADGVVALCPPRGRDAEVVGAAWGISTDSEDIARIYLLNALPSRLRYVRDLGR